MKHPLQSTLKRGLLNLPGATPASKSLLQHLLHDDYLTHHCFMDTAMRHNHSPHHLIAAYDLGAPAPLLQAIYDEDKSRQRPIQLDRPKDDVVAITEENWTEKLGDVKAYLGYLDFFSAEIAARGVSETTEKYIFSPEANGNGALMLSRFVGGALHPMIQFGGGAEFDEELHIAMGLAQTAMHPPDPIEVFPSNWPYDGPSATYKSAPKAPSVGRQPSQGLSLLEVLRVAYDSPKMTPVLPYDPNAFLRIRIKSAMADGRPEEVARIAELWSLPEDGTDEEWESRVEECLWLATLLTAGTSKPNRTPRVDFFLMHTLTSALFLPSVVRHLTKGSSKRALFRSWLREVLLILLIRGRPRIDPSLLMSYTEFPQPPSSGAKPTHSSDALGETASPWFAIIGSASRHPEAHVPKTIRSLLYAAQKYGTTLPGEAIGAFKDERGKEETHIGTGKMDGTIFIRAAGVVMDTLGWVDHGQKAGNNWDTSALGWDAAWD